MAFAGQRGGFLAAIRWLLGGITGRPADQETARVHAGQAVNQSAVATSDVQHVRTRRDRRREDSVEVFPPPRISHTPETYQLAAREGD
jgi:hypothetical protein